MVVAAVVASRSMTWSSQGVILPTPVHLWLRRAHSTALLILAVLGRGACDVPPRPTRTLHHSAAPCRERATLFNQVSPMFPTNKTNERDCRLHKYYYWISSRTQEESQGCRSALKQRTIYK
ncbi:uncharacterized protein LOC134792756 [Cydia splendana]|uniref:uncharacterized protein LOC134792756 n=1 Tax=Cydia splendana TaxID=1100963 RepID=UPI00300CE325